MKTLLLGILTIVALAGCGRSRTTYPCFPSGLSAGQGNYFVVYNVEETDITRTCCENNVALLTDLAQFQSDYSECVVTTTSLGTKADCSALGTPSAPYNPAHTTAAQCGLDLPY